MTKKIEEKIEYTEALIYGRVSSDRQVKEGNGLNSQDLRCVAKAKELYLEVAAKFPDSAISGKLFDRPAMNDLMAYMDAHPNKRYVIIFDDLKRFARDVEVHLKLKTELVMKRKAKLVCLNFNFEDTPTGRFIEVVMAAGAQLEREQNAEQVNNKMKSRLEVGVWPFCFPIGLKNIKDKNNKIIIEHLANAEPIATIYKTAIEKFVNYELETKESVRQFILQQYAVHGIDRILSLHGVDKILRQLLYSGWVEYKPWGVSLRKGKHKGFIELDTHYAALKRLDEIAKPRLRTDYNLDFPLRNYLLCPFCKTAMTASWHKGKMGKLYPHYWCKQSGCPNKNKSVSRDDVEVNFQRLLAAVIPQPEVMEVADLVLADLWNQRQELERGERKRLSMEADKLQADADVYKARIGKAKSDTAVEEYEKEMVKILKEKDSLLTQNIRQPKYPSDKFGTRRRVVFKVIENPLLEWKNGSYQDKRLLLNMYFRSRICYGKKTGFGTHDLPLILKVLSGSQTSKNTLVDTRGYSSNPLFDYLARFWRFYQSSPNLQNLLVKAT